MSTSVAFEEVVANPDILGFEQWQMDAVVEVNDTFQGEACSLASGENNKVLLFGDNIDYPYVLKYPIRDPRAPRRFGDVTAHEAQVLELISGENAPKAPLKVPEMVRHERNALVVSYIVGSVLTLDEVSSFSEAEQKSLGVDVARFVAWLGNTVSLDTYKKCIDPSTQPDDRQAELTLMDLRLVWQDEIGQHALAEASERLHREYRRLLKAGKLQKTIVGHEDLRPANWVFDESDPQNRRLKGVIDFGNTQPSTPERELRHLVYVGSTAIKAAVQEYKNLTGTEPSEHLIWFWARAHTTISATYGTLAGFKVIPAPEIRKGLETVWPHFDWGEITGDYSYVNEHMKNAVLQ